MIVGYRNNRQKIKICCRGEIILVACMYMLILISGLLARVELHRIAFLLYLLTAIYFIPGYFLLEAAGLGWKCRTEKLFFSFAIGWSVNALLYLFLLVLGLHTYSRAAGAAYAAIMTACAALHFWKKRREAGSMPGHGMPMPPWLPLFLAAAWAVAFLAYDMANRDPSITGYLEWGNQDNVYWMRNTAAVMQRFPVPRMSALGVQMHGHYFSNLQIAFLHYLTGIEITDLSFALSYVWNLFLLAGGVFCFFRELLCKGRYVCLGMACTLLSTGTLVPWTHISYLHHVFVASFGFVEGYSLSFYAFIGAYMACSQRGQGMRGGVPAGFKAHAVRWAVMLAVFAAALGAKAPVACIALVGIGLLLFHMLAFDRDAKYAIAAGLPYLAVFAIECGFIFYSPYNVYTAGSARRMGLSLVRSLTEHNMFYQEYQGALSGMLHSRVLSAGILAAVFLFMSNFVANYYMGASLLSKCIQAAKGRKGLAKGLLGEVFTAGEAVLYLTVLASYAVFIVFWQDGYSQSYFIYMVLPYGAAAAFMHFEKADCAYGGMRALEAAGLVLLGISIAFTLEDIAPHAEKGARNLLHIREATDMGSPAGNSLTQGEEEALRWAREHTDTDAVFATNKLFCQVNGAYSFVSSAYTQRQMYLEGWAYEGLNSEEWAKREGMLAGFYTGDKAAAKALKNQGVSYALVFMDVGGYTGFASGDVAYDNGSVKVVRL